MRISDWSSDVCSSDLDIWIVEPNAAPLQGIIARGVHHAPDAADLPADLKPALMVFAVKPQMLAAALPHYRRFADPESPGGGAAALSIAAGGRLAGFEPVLGEIGRASGRERGCQDL